MAATLIEIDFFKGIAFGDMRVFSKSNKQIAMLRSKALVDIEEKIYSMIPEQKKDGAVKTDGSIKTSTPIEFGVKVEVEPLSDPTDYIGHLIESLTDKETVNDVMEEANAIIETLQAQDFLGIRSTYRVHSCRESDGKIYFYLTASIVFGYR